MEHRDDPIGSDETLIRRIPPSTDDFRRTCERKDGGWRATTPSMSTRSGEEHLSCSRLKLISPKRLLEDLCNDAIDPSGWDVCQFKVSDITDLGLAIEFTPTDRDPGHCSITGPGGLDYPNKKAQKLARRTRILTPEKIDELSNR